jgi:hypothetical protein
MIDTLYSTLGYKPKIFCVFPPPAQASNCCCIADTSFTKEMIPVIQQVAADRGLPTINCHQTSYQSNPGPSDGVHPTLAGVDSLGHWFYRGLTTIRMISYPATISFTILRGQTDTIGTTKLDSIANAAIAGTLDSVKVSHKATWLQCKVNSAVRNSQKVANTISLTTLPTAAGVYYDTVTLTATNANPGSIQYIVAMTLQPSTDIKGAAYASSGFGPDVRFIKSSELLITTFKPGKHAISLITTTGREVASKIINGAATTELLVPKGFSGVYIVTIKSQGEKLVNKTIFSM